MSRLVGGTMTTTIVNAKEFASRSSKISKTPEWEEVTQAITKGIAEGQAIRTSFCAETIHTFKNSEKAALAFVQKINRDFKDDYISRVHGGDVIILKRNKKKGSKNQT
jgi:hypothetical protein